MAMLAPETIDKLAGHILNARDKRIITFTVMALYVAAVIAAFVLPAFGKHVAKEALDSIETVFLVVVCAHLTASVATRGASAYVAAKAPAGEAETKPEGS